MCEIRWEVSQWTYYFSGVCLLSICCVVSRSDLQLRHTIYPRLDCVCAWRWTSCKTWRICESLTVLLHVFRAFIEAMRFSKIIYILITVYSYITQFFVLPACGLHILLTSCCVFILLSCSGETSTNTQGFLADALLSVYHCEHRKKKKILLRLISQWQAEITGANTWVFQVCFSGFSSHIPKLWVQPLLRCPLWCWEVTGHMLGATRAPKKQHVHAGSWAHANLSLDCFQVVLVCLSLSLCRPVGWLLFVMFMQQDLRHCFRQEVSLQLRC